MDDFNFDLDAEQAFDADPGTDMLEAIEAETLMREAALAGQELSLQERERLREIEEACNPGLCAAFASPEAESLLLSACLASDGGTLRALLDSGLRAAAFTERDRIAVFLALEASLARHGSVDMFLAYEWLLEMRKGDLRNHEWRDVLLHNTCTLKTFVDMEQFMPGLSAVKEYAQTVMRHAARRAIREKVAPLVTAARQMSGEEFDLQVERILRTITQCAQDAGFGGEGCEWLDFHAGLSRYLEVLMERMQDPNAGAWSSGIKNLDAAIGGGLRPGQMYVLGARPAMGKSAFALSVAANMSQERHVGYLNLELQESTIMDRLVANTCSVPLQHLTRPDPENTDWDALTVGIKKTESMRLSIFSKNRIEIEGLGRAVRKKCKEQDLKVLVVDFLTLVDAPKGMERSSEHEKIAAIVRELKQLTSETGIALLLLCQLNRDIERRAVKRPNAADFRASGSIEEYADVAFALTREAAGKPDIQGARAEHAMLVMIKNRHGSAEDVHLRFQGQFQRFSDWDGEAPDWEAEGAQMPKNFRGIGYDGKAMYASTH